MRVLSHLAVLSLLTALAVPARAQSAASAAASAAASNAAPSIALSVATPVSPATSALTLGALAGDSASAIAATVSPQLASVSMTGLRAGVHPLDSNAPAVPTLAAKNAGFGQPVALMVVGFAGLVAGAIIGGTPGTVVMVGGAAVGLIGLYQYLQ
jgi:hypothetical protein